MASKRIYDSSKAKDPILQKRTRHVESTQLAEVPNQTTSESWRSSYFEKSNDSKGGARCCSVSGYTPWDDESWDEQEMDDHLLLLSEGRENLTRKYTLKEGAKTLLYHASLVNILIHEIQTSAEYLLQLEDGDSSPLVDVERASTKRNVCQLVKRIERILKHGIYDVAGAATLNVESTAG